MELRIPGARYAPIHIERGGARSSLDDPPSLIEAQLIIVKHLKERPNDLQWLQVRARMEFLLGRYEASIKLLQQALESQPDSPSLLADLALGYFEQAQAAERPVDYGNAIEYLGQTIAKSPDEPVAIFNRALACEKVFLYTQAIDDWKHYLRIDPRSGWADEARQHLDKLQATMQMFEQSLSEPLLTPSEFGLKTKGTELPDAVDNKIEEYVHQAIVDWIPKGYSGQQPRGPSGVRRALRALAQLTASKHNDMWLSDLLAGSSDQRFGSAVANLSRALKANDDGDVVSAQKYAAKADHLFTASHNIAGTLRARVEYVFATHIDRNGHDCLRAAAAARRLMGSHSYPWLRSQFYLEEGTCFWLMGNLGNTRRSYQKAADEAATNRYGAIFLRTQDHLASLAGATGDLRTSWTTIFYALERFWTGRYPAMRGYNLYFNLFENARLTKQPHLQVAAWELGLSLSDSFSDTTLRGMAHSLMADAYVAAGQQQSAVNEFSLAAQLLKSGRADKTTRIARMEAETRLAEVEISLGRVSQAADRLEKLTLEVNDVSDDFLAVLFYANLADAEARLKRDKAADSALRSAVTFAEADLESFRDERSRLAWSRRFSSAYRNLVQLKLRQGDVRGALELWEWYRGAALRSNKETPSRVRTKDVDYVTDTELGVTAVGRPFYLPEPQEVQTQIPGLIHETVISYSRLPGGFVAWMYDSRGIVQFQLETPPERIQDLAHKFSRLCSNPESNIDELRQAGRRLYDVLIAPIENRLVPERTFVIEADDALTGIPFEALVDKQNRYLAERMQLASSLGAYYRSRARRSSPVTVDSQALIVAVPIPVPGLAAQLSLWPLPDASDEARIVAGSFRSSQLLVGSQATIAAVRGRLPHSGVFHFAGHAISSAHHSGLLMADALLTPEILERIDLSRLQLVVFSACDSLGEPDGGDYDLTSLVRLFASAGVPHFVASRWNVNSSATRQFMAMFYEQLHAGDTVAVAMKRAESGIRAKPGLDHPYYWAGFTQFGAD